MARRRADSCSLATPSMAGCCARRTNSVSMTLSTSCSAQHVWRPVPKGCAGPARPALALPGCSA